MIEAGSIEKRIQVKDSAANVDSLYSLYAKNIFELGRTHEQLGNPDSAENYYHIALNSAPVKDTLRAQYVYNYARMIDQRDKEGADSLHQINYDLYKRTTYGKEAKVRLGYTDYASIDSVAELYQSGSRFRSVGDYPMAIRQFLRVSDEFSRSLYAPRSLYSVGWIWERQLHDIDSALFYYTQLMKRYPESEYSDDIKYGVVYAYGKRGQGDTTYLPWDKKKVEPKKENPKAGDPPTKDVNNPFQKPPQGIQPPQEMKFNQTVDTNPQITQPTSQQIDSVRKVSRTPTNEQPPTINDTLPKKPR